MRAVYPHLSLPSFQSILGSTVLKAGFQTWSSGLKHLVVASVGLAATLHLGAVEAPKPLDQSTIIEVINDVSVLSAETMAASQAEATMRFKAPDFLQTGRHSRARLEADDGTVTRVGANTLFSFEETDRTINLKKGSLLFHSPTGRGGGRIVTASATASVVGTTIIVTATEDGGFKLLVLEGIAQITYPNGDIRILEAGQMTYILPSESGALVRDGDPAGEPGPVFNFDLARLIEASRLLNGFSESLPSSPMIQQMIQRQQSRIASGDLEKTNARIVRLIEGRDLVLEADTNDLITSFTDIRDSGGSQDEINDNPELDRLRVAAQSQLSPQSDGYLPEKHFFPFPGIEIPANFLPGIEEDDIALGLIAGQLDFESGALDISPILLGLDPATGNEFYQIRSADTINLVGSLSLVGYAGPTFISLGALNTFNIAEDSSIGFDYGYPVHFQMGVDGSDLSLSSFSIYLDQGRIEFYSKQDVNIRSSFIQAGYNYFSAVAGFGVETEITETAGIEVEFEVSSIEQLLSVDGFNVSVEDSYLSAADEVDIKASNQIVIDASTVEAPFIDLKARDISVRQLNSYASTLRVIGEDLIDFRDSSLMDVFFVNMAARTLVLSDVQFSSGSIIELGSESGLLAPNPNSEASVVNGYVNFIQNVTLDGTRAEFFVAESQGGSATGPAAINIFAISPLAK